MKKKGIFLLLLGLVNVNLLLFAQGKDDGKRKAEFEAFKEKRVAFITQAVNFTADEAKAFWPLYNELQEKKFELNKQQRKALSEFRENEKGGKKYTENDYKNIVNLINQFRAKDAALDEEYVAKFSKVISYEKIFRYQQAELKFARDMIRQRGDSESQRKR
jgi:hypothetical protein